MGGEFAEEVVVGSSGAVGRSFGGMFEELHARGCVVPEERGVDEPTIFFDVEGVATAFVIVQGEVVFAKEEVRDGGGEHRVGPSENRLWIRREVVERFVADEGDEEGVFIDDDGATTGEATNQGDGRGKCVEVDEVGGMARDAEDNGGSGAGVDQDKVVCFVAKKMFFEAKLVVDGGVFELDELKHGAGSGARP